MGVCREKPRLSLSRQGRGIPAVCWSGVTSASPAPHGGSRKAQGISAASMRCAHRGRELSWKAPAGNFELGSPGAAVFQVESAGWATQDAEVIGSVEIAGGVIANEGGPTGISPRLLVDAGPVRGTSDRDHRSHRKPWPGVAASSRVAGVGNPGMVGDWLDRWKFRTRNGSATKAIGNRCGS